MNPVLVARTGGLPEEVTARIEGVKVTILPADLADPAAPEALVRELEARGLVVDHLINNAGVGPQGRFQDIDPSAQRTAIDVNVRAATELAARLLPGTLARHRGGMLMQSPDAVARRALRDYERDACHVLPFLPFRLLAWGTRLVH